MIDQVGAMAHPLELPDNIQLHPVFHISLLRNFIGNPSNVPVPIPSLSNESSPILTPQGVLPLRTICQGGKSISQALVLWESLPKTKATWENLDRLRREYPHLNLEDKVPIQARGNDMNKIEPQQIVADVANHEANMTGPTMTKGLAANTIMATQHTKHNRPQRPLALPCDFV